MTFSAARRLDRRDPAFALLAMGIALVLAKLLHGLVDHYWSRGAILFWAGAGFVILSYLASRKPHVKADGPPTIVRAVQQ